MRHIALLEFQPGMDVDITPPSSYMERTNGTLAAQACRLTVDGNGMMVTGRPLAPGDRRVLLLGGSAIENLYVPPPARIASRLEQRLDGAELPSKVYNAAHSGAHLLHMFNTLLNVGIGLRPDYVVAFPTPGLDIYANEIENGFWNPAGNIATVRKGKQLAPATRPEACRNLNGFADQRALLRTLSDTCRNFGARLLVATWPLYGPYDAFLEGIQANRERFEAEERQTVLVNGVIREICAERGDRLLDLERIFAELDHHQHFYDWNHPNVRGCETIAAMAGAALYEMMQPTQPQQA